MTIDDLQAGDLFVYERATVLVTSVYRRPDGGTTYTLGASYVCAEFPPSIMELPAPIEPDSFQRVLRPKLAEIPRR